MAKKAFITLVLFAPLAIGCLPSDPTVGRGGITLSPGVQSFYQQYEQERSPGHFAVSADGRYAHYDYCPEARCLRGSKTKVIYACEQRSKGSPCKIYGAYGKVVWEEADG